MRKLDTIFIGVVLLIALAVPFNVVARKFGVLPRQQISSLESRKLTKWKSPTVASVRDESFQSGFNQWLSDRVPGRSAFLLGNASVQRTQIAMANLPFGWPAYHSYYGSTRVYCPASDSVYAVPNRRSPDLDAQYAEAVGVLSGFSARNPRVNVFVLEVDESRVSSANPAHELVANPVDTAYVHNNLLDRLPEGITVVGHSIRDATKLTQAYFKTDHHWRIPEAYKAYSEAMAAMRPEEHLAEPSGEREFDVSFLGSNARAGLCVPSTSDSVLDYDLDMRGVVVTADGNVGGYELLDSWDRYAEGGRPEDMFANIYADYFHGDCGLLEITSDSVKNGKGLLIVGNSYTNCMERFFANSYEFVYKIDGRHSELLADDFLAAHPEVEDVLILGLPEPVLGGTLAAR